MAAPIPLPKLKPAYSRGVRAPPAFYDYRCLRPGQKGRHNRIRGPERFDSLLSPGHNSIRHRLRTGPKPMNPSQPIGVFDSGIGGLTVVHALMHHLPHENIVYFGDTARVPYGPKSAQVVREYAAQDTDVLLEHEVKMIVVACNTVSAVALDVVQKRSQIPVVGG